MAKQVGPIKIVGTFEEVCFYQMEGQYYVRMKSSLTRKRFEKDRAFEGSRRSAERFAAGNRLASKLYRRLPGKKREYSLFLLLKKKAIALLKEGKSESEAEGLLLHDMHGSTPDLVKAHKLSAEPAASSPERRENRRAKEGQGIKKRQIRKKKGYEAIKGLSRMELCRCYRPIKAPKPFEQSTAPP